MIQSNEPNTVSIKYTGGSCVGCGLRFAWCTCNGPKDVPLGWRCPSCGKGLAPHVSECSCKIPVEILHVEPPLEAQE